MKLIVKTLKGTHFEIVVQPSNSITAVKKNIEELQGKDSYPWGQQLLIHNGKVLKDESTLEENKVDEDGFLVVMLSKLERIVTVHADLSKTSATAGASSSQPSTTPKSPPPAPTEPPPEIPEPSDDFDEEEYNLVPGSNLDSIVNHLMDMGGGNWNRHTVARALRAAYYNAERAVDYLYSGIPEAAEVAVPVAHTLNEAALNGPGTLSGLPNSSPLNMFPQGTPSLGTGGSGDGSLYFLRHNAQFQALRTMVQANPRILQPMLQELSKQNPQLLRLIQEHHAEFLQLINEPAEGVEEDLFEQPEQEMPDAISVTSAEQEVIDRLEAMGFDRARVIEAFLACDRNEELAANYLLEHAGNED